MFGKMSTGQKIFTGLGATALAAPFLAGGPEEVVEEAEDQIDVDAIKQSARDFYMGTGGKNLSFMHKKNTLIKIFMHNNQLLTAEELDMQWVETLMMKMK